MSTETESDVQSTGEQKGLTLWPATALVTGTIVGAGIFTLPAKLAEYGPISLVGFAITAFGATMLALVFARLARRTPDVGGPYAYARTEFGDFVGLQAGVAYWIGAWTAVAAISVSLVGYLGNLIPAVEENKMIGLLCAVGAIALVAVVNSRGVVTGGMLSFVLAIMKVVPLFAIGTIGFLAFQVSNLGTFNGSGLPPFEVIAIVMTLTLFAFIGVEAATVPAGDVFEPHKTIPRATMIGTIAAAAIYLMSTAAVFGAVPNKDLQTSSAPFALAAENMWGAWAGPAISVVAVISCLGAMNGMILLAGQVPMAASFDGLAPRMFGKLDRFKAPAVGLTISAVLASVFTATNFMGGDLVSVYAKLLLIATVMILIPYIFSAGAELKWVLVDRGDAPLAHVGRSVAVALLAIGYSIIGFMGAGSEEIYWVYILMLFAIPGYVAVLWVRKRQDEQSDSAIEEVPQDS